MKNWMKNAASLFILAIAPLAHAEASADQAMGARVKDQVVTGAEQPGSTDRQTPAARELSETLDRLNRRVAELEAQQSAREANLGDPNDHKLWP